METIKATLQNNRIKWNGTKPKEVNTSKSYNIEIKIIDEEQVSSTKNDLVDFFKNSPFYGIDLDLERDKDYGRDIVL